MSIGIDWDAQRVFLAVLEEGSFAGAARRLGLSHPTVRAQVERLEAATGTVLFTRTTNGLAATEGARSLEEPARAMSIASDRFMRLASGPAGAAAGVVRLSVSEVMGVEVVPDILAHLRQTHPQIRIELALSNRQADVLSQEVDIALRNAEPRQRALLARKLRPIPLGFFASHGYVAARGEPQSMRDLETHDIIGPDRDPLDLIAAGRLGPGLWPERAVLRTDSHVAQLAAARAGVGIAIAQVHIGMRDPELVRVLPETDFAQLPVWVVTHEDLRHLPRIRAVLDALVEGFAG